MLTVLGADLLTRIHGCGANQHNKLPAGPDDLWVKTVYTYFHRALALDDKDPKTLFQYANFLRLVRNALPRTDQVQGTGVTRSTWQRTTTLMPLKRIPILWAA